MFWILALALRRKESHYARPVLYGILTLGWMGFIAAIVAGEYLLAKKSISSGEPLYAIGQWGPLVAVGLTVVVGYLHPGLECFFTKARGNKERSKV
ncbi:hypothetical protein DFH09DRAFT_1137129 [Mycena vulgaris]|nr:hypothetical protein DFH09DRAFT_1137129 [Mycena vulgaris]